MRRSSPASSSPPTRWSRGSISSPRTLRRTWRGSWWRRTCPTSPPRARCPRGCCSTIRWATTRGTGRSWTGLAEALAAFACPLIGGDTVSLPAGAPRVLTVTALGRDAVAPPRSGGRAGDALWVTGTIGDAGDGLAIARGAAGPAALLAAYRPPAAAPRRRSGAGAAGPCDVRRVGRAADRRRTAGRGQRDGGGDRPRRGAAVGRTIAGRLATTAPPGSPPRPRGDDYQLLFAAAPDLAPPVPATRVGWLATGSGLSLVDGGEAVPLPPRLGFEHRG